MRRTIKTAFVMTALAFAAPTLAGDTVTQTTVVSYDDLDLSLPEHVEILDRRLLAAAREVCTDSSWFNRSCVRRTYAEARNQVASKRTLALASRK